MQTECMSETLAFQGVAGRAVIARFDGGTLTSDGGAVLLREVERATNVLGQFAACFTDHRDPTRVTHPVASLVRQRVYGLALGYEDLNDHDALRHDPLIAVLADSPDLAVPGAGKSTLNRLELTGATVGDQARYKKITVDHAAVDRLFVDVFVQAHATPPTEILLDLDAHLCASNVCQKTLNGTVLMRDQYHFTALGAEALAGWIALDRGRELEQRSQLFSRKLREKVVLCCLEGEGEGVSVVPRAHLRRTRCRTHCDPLLA